MNLCYTFDREKLFRELVIFSYFDAVQAYLLSTFEVNSISFYFTESGLFYSKESFIIIDI